MNSISLKDPSLLRRECFVAGTWIQADSGETLDVLNPSTGVLLGTVPRVGAAETRRAIEAGRSAMAEWAGRPAKARAQVLRKWYDLMMLHQDDLAAIMTAEQGKPLAESRGEIAYAAGYVEWFAE